MDFWLFELWLGVCLSAAVVSSFSDLEPPTVENVHWVSVDFKTILKWSVPPSNYTYTVMFSKTGLDSPDYDDDNTTPECIEISDTECDLTYKLLPYDTTFIADVVTEGIPGQDFDPEEMPHTKSASFNPYRQSELSAVTFSIQKVAERSVTLNISDPLTGIHSGDKQLTIRDILKKDLKYKVSYYKSGSTGKRDLVVDSNLPQIPNLDPGQSYCFMVAAYVPSRAKAVQQGAWSSQACTSGFNFPKEVELGTVFQAIFIPLVLLIILVTVVIIYCRCCRGKRKASNMQQPTAHYTVV